MAKMNWNAKNNEYEGETAEYFVYVDADEMAETVAEAEKQGYNPDEMPEFSAEGWVEIGQAGNSSVKVVSKNWGGARAGAGRPQGTAKGTTYQEGYNAGYQAGKREYLAFLKSMGFASKEEYERVADQDWLDLSALNRLRKR